MRTLSKALFFIVPVVFLSMLLTANLIAPLDPNQISDEFGLFNPLAGPSAKHILGTNALGMDLWSRMVHGSRTAILVASIVVLAAFLIGVAAGLIAGWFEKWIDQLLRSFFDFSYAMPGILLAIGLSFALSGGRPGYLSTIAAVIFAESLTYSAKYFYIVRSSVLSLKNELFVVASEALGAPSGHLLTRHLLPNIIKQTMPLTAQSASAAISTLAGLGFLGLGIGYGLQPEWGFDLGQAIGSMMMGNYWPLIASLTPLLVMLLWLSFAGEKLARNGARPSKPVFN
jgi:peptide/nickel transport system permease protein